LQARDERDTQRAVAPLRPVDGSWVLDSSQLSIEAVVSQIIGRYQSQA